MSLLRSILRFLVVTCGAAVVLAQVDTSVSLNLPAAYTAAVNPGAVTASIPFTVQSCTALRLQVIAPLNGVSMAVVNPSGIAVAAFFPSSPEFFSGSSLTPALPGGIFTTGNLISQTNSGGLGIRGAPETPSIDGAWRLDFQFSVVPAKTAVQASVFCQTSYQAAIVFDRTRYLTGENVSIGMLILNNGIPVGGVVPSIRITPKGSTAGTTLTGQDSGLGADSRAGDGIYSVDYTFLAAGTYDISGSVSVPSLNGTVSRSANRRVDVVDPSVQIGSIAANATYAAGGCINGLDVIAAANITRLGDFLVNAVLSAGNGKTISATALNTLPVGSGNLKVSFGVDQLKQLGVNPPFVVSSFTVEDFYNGKPGLAFMQSGAATASGFNLNQGCAAPIELASVLHEALNLSGGFIESLDVSFSLRFQIAGTYTLSFKVVGPQGQDFGLFSQTRTVSAGSTVEFTQRLADDQFLRISGPYSVISLLVSGPASASFSSVGSTSPLSFWQFLPKIKGDLTNDGAVTIDDYTLLEFQRGSALVPGDRRDLNGDGFIDGRDLAVLRTLLCAAGTCFPFR